MVVKKGRHMKILVELDVERPLLRGTMLKCDNQIVWVDFKYENIALFCFYCGKVGNAEKRAQTRKIMQYAVEWLMGTMGSGFGLS